MNAGDCFSENRHKTCIRSVRSGKFHVVGKLVRRDALQYELAGISVLTFIAFERSFQETNPDCNDEAENDYRQSPPCKLHELSAEVGLAHHESSYFDEKRKVATDGGVRNFG